mmetsp:Transcript_56665/g.136100  ORF Transcript_56665/g.136100 Transcript_56665/m.136100 type:complete len:225 (-) Transcript_56665:118-792(-)
MCCSACSSGCGARRPAKSVTVPLPGACTRSCTQCDDTAKVISALRHQPTPSWSPTSTMRSVMNCAMHCRMEVSAKVTLNHGPCASSTTCPSCSTSLTCTASPAEKSTPSSSSSNSGAPARRDTHASFTGCRLASIGANGGAQLSSIAHRLCASKRRWPTTRSAARKAVLDSSNEPTSAALGPPSNTPSSQVAPSLMNCGRRLSWVWKRQAGKRSSASCECVACP